MSLGKCICIMVFSHQNEFSIFPTPRESLTCPPSLHWRAALCYREFRAALVVSGIWRAEQNLLQQDFLTLVFSAAGPEYKNKDKGSLLRQHSDGFWNGKEISEIYNTTKIHVWNHWRDSLWTLQAQTPACWCKACFVPNHFVFLAKS